MENIIDAGLVTEAQNVDFHGPFLQPYFEIVAAHERNPAAFAGASGAQPWVWTDRRAVERCLDHTWSMLGKWQARRSARVDRQAFDRRVPEPVCALARTLNHYGIRTLLDLAYTDVADYGVLLERLHASLAAIARIKPTKNLSVMFGSKVLHHFFPSIVPVYDGRMIRDDVMGTEVFDAYLREGGSCVHWESAEELGSPEEYDYHLWFAFCVDQIVECNPEELIAARKTLAEALHRWIPAGLRERPGSLPWHLDAKVAEFCAEAHAWLPEEAGGEPEE